MEVWKRVDYLDNISVSSDGNVRNDKTGKVYKPCVAKTGYCVITGPDRKQYRIHRLVAYAFQDICGEYKDGFEVDHINTLKEDNRAVNLRWISKKDNANNPLTRLHKSESKKGDKNPMKNPEVSKKVSDWHKGRQLSDDCKSLISQKLKGRTFKDETIIKMSITANNRIRNNKGQFIR